MGAASSRLLALGDTTPDSAAPRERVTAPSGAASCRSFGAQPRFASRFFPCADEATGLHSPKTFMGEKKDRPGAILQGTLDMLILHTVAQDAMHGYAIAESIQQRSKDVLKVEEGALYPALHRLELRGWLSSEWGASENNRRAKYYRLTARGRRALEAETQHWTRMAAAIARVLEPA